MNGWMDTVDRWMAFPDNAQSTVVECHHQVRRYGISIVKQTHTHTRQVRASENLNPTKKQTHARSTCATDAMPMKRHFVSHLAAAADTFFALCASPEKSTLFTRHTFVDDFSAQAPQRWATKYQQRSHLRKPCGAQCASISIKYVFFVVVVCVNNDDGGK